MSVSENPLVSIAVLTYNSAATVIETLNSIKDQTYQNTELIVSDDCSTDNTVEVCRKWIAENEKRFVRAVLLEVPKNTGVTANANRADKACQSEWIKSIAGDDLLLPHCIEQYVSFVIEHPDTVYLFGKVDVFGNDSDKVSHFTNTIFDYSFFNLSIEEQYDWLVLREFQPIPALSSFYNKHRTESLGIIYDERIPMLDDWPRWIQCLEKGVRFAFVDQVVAKYRVSPDSICSGEKYSHSFGHSLDLLYIFYQYKPAIKRIGYLKATGKYIERKARIDGGVWWLFCSHLVGLMRSAYNRVIIKK